MNCSRFIIPTQPVPAMFTRAFRDTGVQLVTKRPGRRNGECLSYEQLTEPQPDTNMSTALKLPAEVITPQVAPIRLSGNELRLRAQFEAAFNDTQRPGWDLHLAVWDVTDDLKHAGQPAESVVKRVKYIAALPVAFHYRFGYGPAHLRLKDTAERAISLAIARYFADERG